MSGDKKPKLTAKQEMFCLEYLKDLNATQAAIRAGYKENTARAIGCENLTKPNISDRIIELNKDRIEEVKIDANFVLKGLAEIADCDIGDIYDDDGRMKPIKDIPKPIRKAIKSIETVEYYEGFGDDKEQVGWIRKIQFWSKDNSFQNLGKHLALFTEKHEHSGSISLEELLTKSKELE